MNSIIMIVTAALLYCMGVVAVRGAEETPWPVVGCGRVMMVNPGATLSMESGAATYSLNLANTAWFIVPAGEYTVACGGGTTNVLVDEGQTYYVTGGGAGIPQWYVQDENCLNKPVWWAALCGGMICCIGGAYCMRGWS